MMRSVASSWWIVVLSLVVGCAADPVEESIPESGPRVENVALGLALASVPQPFELRNADDQTLVLTAPLTSGGEGEVVVAVGPPEAGGINLVETVKQKSAYFETLPDGQSFGNQELGTQIGAAFTARGSFTGDAGPHEETWIFALHPTENRLLTLSYSYPAGGDSAARAQELLAVLVELEALPAQ